MASISASSFINPRLAAQILNHYMVDMIGRSEAAKVYVLDVTIDPDRIEVHGHKEVTSEDGGDLLWEVTLPRKMTMAMYHAALAKGYLR